MTLQTVAGRRLMGLMTQGAFYIPQMILMGVAFRELRRFGFFRQFLITFVANQTPIFSHGITRLRETLAVAAGTAGLVSQMQGIEIRRS